MKEEEMISSVVDYIAWRTGSVLPESEFCLGPPGVCLRSIGEYKKITSRVAMKINNSTKSNDFSSAVYQLPFSPFTTTTLYPLP